METEKMANGKESKTPAQRSRQVIDENLKRAFQEIQDDELPESLKQLLDRLAAEDDDRNE